MTGNPPGSSGSATPNTGGNPSGVRQTVALFPGAFRPPHINHYETVRRLAERTDVDEVVVVQVGGLEAAGDGTATEEVLEPEDRVTDVYLIMPDAIGSQAHDQEE